MLTGRCWALRDQLGRTTLPPCAGSSGELTRAQDRPVPPRQFNSLGTTSGPQLGQAGALLYCQGWLSRDSGKVGTDRPAMGCSYQGRQAFIPDRRLQNAKASPLIWSLAQAISGHHLEWLLILWLMAMC
jgi:hypothetical protein